VISRIERDPVSKGRFAQRLAAHIEELDLRTRIRQLLGYPPDRPVATSDLLALPGCGPALALLDDLRRRYEDLPLAPTKEEADPPQATSGEPGA